MTYNLQDFKTWLLVGKSQIIKQKFKGDNLSAFYLIYEQNPDKWATVIHNQEEGTLRQEVVNEWIAEVGEREREREREQNNTMTLTKDNFIKWYKEKFSQEELPKFLEVFINSVLRAEKRKVLAFEWSSSFNEIWNWNDSELGDVSEPANLFFQFGEEEYSGYSPLCQQVKSLKATKIFVGSIITAKKEFNQIKQEKNELETKFQEQTTNLTNLHQQLDLLKSELSNKSQECQTLSQQLSSTSEKNTDLESQITALAISSGLLTSKIEDLSTKLLEAEEKARLEKEIQSNLIREQENKVSEQEKQLTNYQNLLKISEENIKKAGEAIRKKEAQLESLEKEKNLIAEELDLASSKIEEMEKELLASDSKIRELENKIRELEGNPLQLEKVKKELEEERKKSEREKDKFAKEIERLRKELAKTKIREEELEEKVKELNKRPIRVREMKEEKGVWEKWKPIFYGVGLVVVIILIGWLWNKVRE